MKKVIALFLMLMLLVPAAIAEVTDPLANEVGVAAVPGTSFFKENVNDIVRVHFAKKDETLYEALNRLNDLKKKIG